MTQYANAASSWFPARPHSTAACRDVSMARSNCASASDTWVPLARCLNHIHGAREGDTPPGLTIVLASA